MCEHHNAHKNEECEQRGRVERSGGPTTSFQPFLGEERRIRIAPVTCCRAWMLVAAHQAAAWPPPEVAPTAEQRCVGRHKFVQNTIQQIGSRKPLATQ